MLEISLLKLLENNVPLEFENELHSNNALRWSLHRLIIAGPSGQDTRAAQTLLLSPAGPAGAIGVPLPAARVSSSPVCIPITGSVGTSGSFGRHELDGSRQRPASIQSSSIHSRLPNGEADSWTRSAPISIPTARTIRPRVAHTDDAMVPPSYEEVTAEHSCGESTTSSAEAMPDSTMVCLRIYLLRGDIFPSPLGHVSKQLLIARKWS